MTTLPTTTWLGLMRMRSCCLLVIAACSGPSAGPADGAIDTGPRRDAIHVDDGAPTRVPCTGQFGTAMTTVFGRLDGFLVAIVPPGGGGCAADADHLHLQVKANGAVYDFAVNVGTTGMEDVHTTTREITMPGAAWTEGWHPNAINDYIALGVHSPDLALETRAQLTAEMMTDLASANHISVFAVGYGPGGGHLIHRNNSGRDGLIVTQPLSNPSHGRMFSFTSLTF